MQVSVTIGMHCGYGPANTQSALAMELVALVKFTSTTPLILPSVKWSSNSTFN